MTVGIESIGVYLGQAVLDTRVLFEARGLDLARFDNLMMQEKSVCLPCEDPVTYGVNAAKPLVDRLSPAERDRIELVITTTESGLDFAKSLSTYIHHYLELSRRCRLFEIKQACYSATAALQMAASYVASNVSPGAKVLVVSTDVQRGVDHLQDSMSYGEPAAGVGAVAMLVSSKPFVLELDFGANGIHGYEVMDTCRPDIGVETGHVDLSLSSYLDCLEAAYRAYIDRVDGARFDVTFDDLAFHTPFAGLVKGAHRNMMRKYSSFSPVEIQKDFEKRLSPSLQYCSRVGNIFGATLYLALCSLIDNVPIDSARRVGLYSYGSGCSSEFFSGVITPASKIEVSALEINRQLNQRYSLTIAEYEALIKINNEWLFGIKGKTLDYSEFMPIYRRQMLGKKLLTLRSIASNYHREYDWS